jgi:glycosyltransferase involved in cell wall biosynthesis
MKIIHIITHLELGGAQKTTLNMMKALKKSGYKVTLLSSRQGLLYQEAKKEFGKELRAIWSLRREINPVFDFISFFKIYFYLKENKFDIVHTHSSKAGILGRWAAKIAGVKKVFHTIHGFGFHESQFFLLRKFYVYLEKFTAGITTTLIAVAPEIVKKGLKNKIGKPHQYKVIPEIVFIPQSDKPEILSKYNPKIKIGMVACLKPQKAPLDFIKSARYLLKEQKNFEFTLIGDGHLRKKVEAYLRDNIFFNNFKLLGWRKDAYNLMKEWDIVVLTSRWEGLPHVIIEAMSLGKAIIATAVDGVKNIIRDKENGLLVSPQNPYQLAEKILLLANDDKLREKLSLNAYEDYKNNILFNPKVNLRKIEEIYIKC